MGATKIEFRLRMLILVAIVFLGFYAPWIEVWGFGPRIPLMEWLALELARMGLMPFAVAAPVVIVLASLIAAVGAVFRVWGAAYLGYGTVHHEQMQAGAVMADGPYRYLRNPLYVGGWCMMAAMAFLMPPTGALVSMTLVTVFFLRLILGEESVSHRPAWRALPRLSARRAAALSTSPCRPAVCRAQAALAHLRRFRDQPHRHLFYPGISIVEL